MLKFCLLENACAVTLPLVDEMLLLRQSTVKDSKFI